MPIEITVALISLACSFLVTIATQLFTDHRHSKDFALRYLSDSLADLFRYYLQFYKSKSDEDRNCLLASIERCRLFCSADFLPALDSFETLLLYDSPDMLALGKSFSRLRRMSRIEVKNQTNHPILQRKTSGPNQD